MASRKDAVLVLDPTAELNSWETSNENTMYWVAGEGWETKLAYSEDRAWDLAILAVSKEVSL